ncbi:pyruvate ferredoxin oxidoreductase [Methanoculleus bourgensis]|jgi:pyruvate ferredoxin oxidoreductase alpha subunit|uniref:Pyruvate ferredoxin oxidoreductase n=3 Tax=Methanoculleus bourgensis TaxID=83986 RepID=A0A7K4C544_9EURY|nr:transketolase C-terminal domain-containing protein [Methanoculleus bourgensis]MBT0732765.1 pyruvate ferredoxin oxidoreductase [Methanoculleus bourgensis]MDD3373818.1 transketolase C-terminal domain-containing protein [Methanoculleus bourgensis]NMA89270.1 pyruvate ferredoxin oxidoreductase [Methanoculleus bourgensis]NQS78390.1 pyruvate ferredoxin oxidoreductase [Methanoculleus bourgensis]SAI89207.1 pyruvate ferredoxin oxidoreductase, alpha subunit [Methanoculleus bourgensis]
MLTIATGNKAVAAAVKAAKPGVIAAYPITPQTEIVEQIAEYVNAGDLASQYIPVESEHSAMAACIGASAGGVRTFTATSSHGLLYMHEMVHWAAGARLPIVMANVNRALGPGWNTWAEHSDAFSQRDTGWLQVFVSTVQEAYDATLMAFKIAEDERVLLPVMVNLDGFALSHIMQSLETVEVGDFLPAYHLPHAVDTENPCVYGPMTGPDDYFRFRWDIERSMRDARGVITEVEREFAERFGRSYGPVEEYRCEGADVVVIAMGTLGKEAEVAIDLLRDEGIKAGSMRLRWFRPFPDLDLAGREVVVIDRDYSFGFGGVVANAVRAKTGVEPYSVIAGLGGQEVTYNDIVEFVRNRRPGEETWFGVSDHV